MPPLMEEATLGASLRPLEAGGRVVGCGSRRRQGNLQGSLVGRGGGRLGAGTYRRVVPRGGGRLTAALGHLHVRSGFSYGFGTSTPEELVEAAGYMGAGSVALTDRDGLYGVPRFLRAAGKVGVGPVVGAEVSMGGGGHLVLLAEDAKGYRSLSKLVTSYRCSSENRRKPLCPLPAL